MCSKTSITEILGINDTNLEILANSKKIIKGVEYTVLSGRLTYTPNYCPKCRCENEKYDIVKNGSQTVKVLFNRVNVNPLLLIIKKQRFYCKHCEATFMAETPLTDKGCFISRDVKKSIVLDLCEIKSMSLIAREHVVSPTTVLRVLHSTETKRKKSYLPRTLSIDEFKSVKRVEGAMSVNITDVESGCIFEILSDRRKACLSNYFYSYPRRVREKVEFVITDMYSPYIDLARKVFPNAKIIIDKFHIVQLLTRNLNKLRINEMNGFDTKSREYKVLKTYWKILLAKKWDLNSIHFYKNKYFRQFTCSVDILDDMLRISPEIREAHQFYQQFLLSIEKNDIEIFRFILNTNKNEIPECFRKSIKTFSNLKKYILNTLKFQYTNGMVEGKNNKIKVIKRLSFGYANFRNFRLRILLMERL